MIKKYKNLIFAIFNIIALSMVNTLKGGIIVECGHNTQFWITELVSLLLTISLLYFVYRKINEGKCTTVVREKRNEVHD